MPSAGDIALIPFPFSDLSAAKKRPILIINSPDRFGDFVCMAITSKEHHQQSVMITQENFRQGILPKTSWIRTDKVFTLSEKLLIKAVGKIKNNILEQSISQLCDFIKS